MDDPIVLALALAPATERLRAPAGAALITIGASDVLLTLTPLERETLARRAGPTVAEQLSWAAEQIRRALNGGA